MPSPFDELNSRKATPPVEITPIMSSLEVSPHMEKQLKADINPSSSAYDVLMESITEFEKNLDSDHEVGARLVSFGSEMTFHITDIDCPVLHIIKFLGKNANNEDVQLIQHVSQLSVLLVAMKKLEDKPRRIGFQKS